MAGATALAFNIGTYEGADTVTVDVNGVQVATIDTPAGRPTTEFFGVTSDEPITSVDFSLATGAEFDFLGFEQGTAVPEPTTWALLLAGAVGLGVVGLRRGRAMI